MSAEPALGTSLFADRLAEAVERKRSQLLVGLDPRPDLLPVELVGDAQVDRASGADGCARFCRGIIDSVAPHVVGVKPQLAFFEALGSDGIRALEVVIWMDESKTPDVLRSLGGATPPAKGGAGAPSEPKVVTTIPGAEGSPASAEGSSVETIESLPCLDAQADSLPF